MTMADDLKRMEYTPGNCYNFHPGSHTGQGAEEGIRLISEMLNEILKPEQTTTVLLETMAGKGTEVGRSFEELAAILERVELKDTWVSAWIRAMCTMRDTILWITSMMCLRGSTAW